MWFVFVLVGLGLLLVAGLYVRRRLGEALIQLGVGTRSVRIMRWVVAWLLYGYPVILIGAIVISRALDQATIPRFDGLVTSWLLAIPFILSVLVVLQAAPWLLAIDLVYIIARRRSLPSAARVRALAMLGVIGAFALYTPIRILVERGDVRMRHHQLAGAPSPSAPPFRIAFLADIQQDVHTDGERARELYAKINAWHPDVVFSGGDWINTGPDYIADAAAAAATLKSKLGTFSVRGDHEHFAYVDRERSVGEVDAAMRAAHVDMVNDKVRWFTHAGKRIGVAFLNYNYIHRADRATVEALLAEVSKADYSIVITHQLDNKLADLLVDKVDLVLGAHTHGGQVNPVVGVLHVPLARLETDYIDGRYQRGATTILVTAGVGYSVVPVRYAAPGSIELIELSL
ncbi:MAG: metallophosphoesterase [Kofleriaceae bacterium]|nr:metallophosphoesterase [Kofleriaceae bacterium]